MGREATEAPAEFGDKIFAMVTDNISNMIEAALHKDVPTNKMYADTVRD